MDGVGNQVSLAKETTWGTAVTPTASMPIRASDGIRATQEVKGIEAINTKPAKNKLFYLGKQFFEGTFELNPFSQALGYFLNSALGGYSVALHSGETIVYDHTFTEAIAKPSYTIEQVIGSQTLRFNGATVSGFKLSGKAGEEIILQATLKAKGQASATKITASYETGRPFNFADLVSFTISGTDIKAYIEDFEIEYDNGLELFWALGATTAQNKYVKQSEVKGKFTCYMSSQTLGYFNDLLAKTERPLIITLTGDTVGTAANNQLILTFSQCDFTKFDTKLSFDYNAVTVEFSAREDPTNGIIKAVLTNLLSTY